MAFDVIVKQIQQLAKNNSHAILTGVGVAGTISTAVLTGRASFRAAERIRNKTELSQMLKIKGRLDENEELTLKYKIGLVWKDFIPPVGVGVITISSIIMANRIAGKEAAAIMAAYTVSEKAFSEYREKVVEKLGASKDEEVRDRVAEARMSKDPLNSREIILAGTGEVLCYDILTGRYFQSSKEAIQRAEIEVNLEIVNYMSASLSHFYDEIGLPPTGMTDALGFNTNRKCQVRFSAQVSSDGRPCLAIDFIEEPILGYSKLWD